MNKEIFRKIENLLRNYNRLEAEIKLIEGEIENIKEYYTGCELLDIVRKVDQQISLIAWLKMK
ncbi:hypothetical protein [Clostridium perfringens]